MLGATVVISKILDDVHTYVSMSSGKYLSKYRDRTDHMNRWSCDTYQMVTTVVRPLSNHCLTVVKPLMVSVNR